MSRASGKLSAEGWRWYVCYEGWKADDGRSSVEVDCRGRPLHTAHLRGATWRCRQVRLHCVEQTWQSCLQRYAHCCRYVAVSDVLFHQIMLNWRPLLPYEYSCKASCARPGAVICNFWHPGTLTLSPWRSGLSVRVLGCQKLQMTA